MNEVLSLAFQKGAFLTWYRFFLRMTDKISFLRTSIGSDRGHSKATYLSLSGPKMKSVIGWAWSIVRKLESRRSQQNLSLRGIEVEVFFIPPIGKGIIRSHRLAACSTMGSVLNCLKYSPIEIYVLHISWLVEWINYLAKCMGELKRSDREWSEETKCVNSYALYDSCERFLGAFANRTSYDRW